MTQIHVLPHPTLCPEGKTFDVEPGTMLCRALLGEGISIEHACEMSCACTTCHVIVRQGYGSLPAASDTEDDMLDKAWGLTSQSRLSCQVIVGQTELTIEVPRYTINHAREEH